MKIIVLSLFPELIETSLKYSILRIASQKQKIQVTPFSYRRWAIDKRGTVDDSPYGGGPGMILRYDVTCRALEELDEFHQIHRILLTPEGKAYNQEKALELSRKDSLLLLCGRYEGFDARIYEEVDECLSIGPYILSGGELAALSIIDTIARLLEGVVGNKESLKNETFNNGLTDYPQYTRPPEYKGRKVPEVLLSGNHAEIEKWRRAHQKRI